MTSPLYAVVRVVLLTATAAMFVLHLVTGKLLQAGARAVTLLRWEAAYYAVLLASAAAGVRALLIPALLLGAVHWAGWLYGEKKLAHGGEIGGRAMVAVQVFDWAEAAALVWIGTVAWRG